jgi:esterase/lipase
MLRNHSELFTDPRIVYPIDRLDLPFSEYIAKSKNIIATHRVDLKDHADLIIQANTPFELAPKTPIFSEKNPSKIKYGALLIHGLLDTPFLMQDVGTALQSEGLLVRSIVLPGHATVPGALLNVTYQDWLQAVRYGIASLKKEVEHIFLVGFSTGATLSLYHTLQDPEAIAGMIMLSPAFKINSSFDFIMKANRSSIWNGPRWLSTRTEIDYTKYRSIAFNAAYQVFKLTQLLKNNAHKKPECPIFMALSREDLIVRSTNSINYFTSLSNPYNQMILYSAASEKLADPRISIRSSIYPSWKIVNFSHIAIPVAPTNFHYGMQGDYPLASHVNNPSHFQYGALDAPKKRYYDLMYKIRLMPYEFQRLTFNPDFEFMMGSIKNFILNRA